jgi:hypothetical protein
VLTNARAVCPVAWLPRRVGKAENRLCKVVCSPHMPEAEGARAGDSAMPRRATPDEFAPADTHLRPPACCAGTYSITDGGVAPAKD